MKNRLITLGLIFTILAPLNFSWAQQDPCIVTASRDINKRSHPSLTGSVEDTLAAGSSAPAIAQQMDEEQYVWWQLEDGLWVREDTVTVAGNCEQLPAPSDGSSTASQPATAQPQNDPPNVSQTISFPLTGGRPVPSDTIAFYSDVGGNDDIYTMDINGGSQTNLTNNPAQDRNPSWSPGGRYIAFETNRDGNFEVYLMTSDGEEVTRLTNNAGYDGTPAWSPDGQFIAFASETASGSEIAVLNLDGGNIEYLTTMGANSLNPAWSPAGDYIVFDSNFQESDGQQRLFVMPRNGQQPGRITGFNAQNPIWGTVRDFWYFDAPYDNRDLRSIGFGEASRVEDRVLAGAFGGYDSPTDGLPEYEPAIDRTETLMAYSVLIEGFYQIYVAQVEESRYPSLFDYRQLTQNMGNSRGPAFPIWTEFDESADATVYSVDTTTPLTEITQLDGAELDVAYPAGWILVEEQTEDESYAFKFVVTNSASIASRQSPLGATDTRLTYLPTELTNGNGIAPDEAQQYELSQSVLEYWIGRSTDVNVVRSIDYDVDGQVMPAVEFRSENSSDVNGALIVGPLNNDRYLVVRVESGSPEQWQLDKNVLIQIAASVKDTPYADVAANRTPVLLSIDPTSMTQTDTQPNFTVGLPLDFVQANETSSAISSLGGIGVLYTGYNDGPNPLIIAIQQRGRPGLGTSHHAQVPPGALVASVTTDVTTININGRPAAYAEGIFSISANMFNLVIRTEDGEIFQITAIRSVEPITPEMREVVYNIAASLQPR